MKLVLIVTVFIGVLLLRDDGLSVDAFVQRVNRERIRPAAAAAGGALQPLQLATKYVVIGGNIDGIGPKQDEDDTYNMSKKERRRREREAGETKNKKKKKKKAFTINYDKLEEKVTRERTLLPRELSGPDAKKSNLGIPSKRKKKNTAEKKLSVKAARIKKQRTAGGTVNSSTETMLPQSPEKQAVEIRIAKRGNKTVTMVQGMTLPMKDRKALLKEMKGKLGGGGTLAGGVLELQGAHAEKILGILKSKGYSEAKVVGGK